MVYVFFDDYNEVLEDATSTATDSKAKLLSKLYLTSAQNADKLIPIERHIIKAVSPYTALDQSAGTCILSHEQDRHECHKAYLVSETPKEVHKILDGTPSPSMVAQWEKRLKTIQDTERSAIHKGFSHVLENKTRETNVRYDRLITDKKHDIRNEQNKRDEIIRHKDQRGILRGLAAFTVGKIGLENDILSDIERSIDGLNHKIETIQEQRSTELDTLKNERDDLLAKVHARFDKESTEEFIKSEIEQLSAAFRLTMLKYKKADSTAKAGSFVPPPSLDDDSAEDNSNFDLGLSRTMSDHAEEPDVEKQNSRERDPITHDEVNFFYERDYDRDIEDATQEITQPFWKNLALELDVLLWDQIERARIQREMERDISNRQNRHRGFELSL